MNEKKNIDCLLLTGMHRSGISALAECLNLMGVNFGKSNLNKSADNGVQSTAINDVVMIHDILLRDLGCKWDMIGALPDGWLNTQGASKAKERIGHLIEDQFQDEQLWAVADPRLCRLMPLWEQIFREKGLNPGILLTVRHPWEVAQSLNENHGIDLQQSHLLWLSLNKEAFDFCQQRLYMVNTYDQILADPASILKDIAEQFDLTFQYPLEQQIHRILDVIRPELKHHHRRNIQQTTTNGESFYPFAWLYDQINHHRSALKLLAQEPAEGADVVRITQEALPTRFFPDTLPGLKEDLVVQKQSSQQGSRIFHSFLTLIGDYERKQRDTELQKMQRILSRTRIPETLYARLYIPSSKKENEKISEDVLLAKNEWQQIRFSIPRPEKIKTQGLDFVPLNTRGVVSVSALSLVNTATEEICWNAATPDAFTSIKLVDALQLSSRDALEIMTTTNEATLTFPDLPDLPDCPMELQVWIKVETSQEKVVSAWQTLQDQYDLLKTDLVEAKENKEAIDAELKEKDNLLLDKEERFAEAAKEDQAQIEALKKSAEISLEQKNAAEDQIKKLSAKLKDREERIDKIGRRLEQELRQHKDLSQQIVERESALQEVEKDFQGRLSLSSAELSRRQNRISKLSKEVESLQYDLDENNRAGEELQSLKRTVEKMEETKVAQSRRLEERESLIQTLRQELQAGQNKAENLDREKARLGQRAKEKDRALNEARNLIQVRFQELAELTEILKEQEGNLSEEKAKTADQAGQISKLNEVLKSTSAELGQKSRQASVQADRIKHFTSEFAKKKTTLKKVNAEMVLLKKQLVQKEKALQAKDIEIDIQRKRNEDLKTTASWKMMAPMRALARPFKKASYKPEPDEKQIEQIRESEIFNPEWYLDQYPDVSENELDPAEHYFYHGVSEGRDPGADFNTTWYMKTYTDIAKTGINPLVHYIKFGKEEGRHPIARTPIEEQIELVRQSNLLDAQWYIEYYPNVREAGMDPATHYCHFGVSEGKNPGPDFDTDWYTDNHSDVAASGMNPLVHYLKFGEKEGRKCKPPNVEQPKEENPK